jgi:hypothetical protein
MSSRAEQLRQQWKEANDKVRAAEDRLHEAWQDFAAGRAGPPDKRFIEDVTRLRRECDQKLAVVLDQYGKLGSANPERPST